MGLLTNNTKAGLASALGSRTGAQEIENLLGASTLALHGAKGDGVSDDTAAIRSALASLRDGDTLRIPKPMSYYRTTAAIVISKQVKIVGESNFPIFQCVTADTNLFEVSASNVTFDGLDLRCHNNTSTYEANSRCIYAYGDSGASLNSGLAVRNCKMSEGSFGVYAKWCENLDISGNHIHDISYAGVFIVSSFRGTIRNNHIEDITDEASFPYGIAITRLLTTDDAPTDIAVSGNVVRNVPWEALDTHTGQRIAFTGNTVYNCKRGVALIGDAAAAPKYCTVSGNTIDSGVTDGSYSHGIAVTGVIDAGGATSTDYADGVSISGNMILNHGDQSSSRAGAIYARDARGLAIAGNTIIQPSPHGVVLDNTIYGYSITGNTIIDCWSEGYVLPSMVMIHTAYTFGVISGNCMATGSKSATNLRKCGVRVHTANTLAEIGTNYYELGPGGVNITDSNALSTFTVYTPKLGFFNTAATARNTGWTAFSNLSSDKTADANASSTEELADILGTLIGELRAKGLLTT